MGQIINLQTLFKNHFDTRTISDDDLKKFSEDHLARITANNPGGILAPIVAPMGAAHTAYFGAISSEDVAQAVQEALTAQVDAKMDEFKRLVRRKEGAIRNAFGENGPIYMEFFPHGLSEYTNADKGNIELLMQRFTTLTATHVADIEDDIDVTFQNFQTAFQAVRTAQLGKKGTVDDLKDASSANRDALETMLIKSLHFIAYQYPGNVEQCMAYFDQSFLRKDGEGEEETPGGGGGNE